METTIIRLMDSTGKIVQDSLSGEYEDSFCLETFEDLCKAHFAVLPVNSKGFIIAREFYSYYNAFHLNKTLFQTQIYLKKRYIHRLHVLNPLTNSDIIGSVQYYLVKAPEKSNDVIIDLKEALILDAEPQKSVRISTIKSPIAILIPNNTSVTQELLISNHKVAFEDSDAPRGLLKSRFSKRPALTVETNKEQAEMIRRNTLTSYPTTDVGLKHSSEKSPSTVQVFSLPPTGPLQVGGTNISMAQAGTVTRFAVPVPIDQLSAVIPVTQKGTRRALSYRNAVSATGVPASFLEWAQMVNEDKDEMRAKSSDAAYNYDAVKPFAALDESSRTRTPRLLAPKGGLLSSSSLKKPHGLEVIIDEEEEEGDEGEMGNERPLSGKIILEEQEVKIDYYDAVLFATDNDFLEYSRTRQMFKNNAILVEDAKLFEMKEFTGERETPLDFEIIGGEAFPCDGCCFPADSEGREMSGFMKFIHAHKCMITSSCISLLVVGISIN